MAGLVVAGDREQLGLVAISSGFKAAVPSSQRWIVTSPAEWLSHSLRSGLSPACQIPCSGTYPHEEFWFFEIFYNAFFWSAFGFSPLFTELRFFLFSGLCCICIWVHLPPWKSPERDFHLGQLTSMEEPMLMGLT